MICVHVARGAGSKACCMKSGAHDGANRHYYFQRVGAEGLPEFAKVIPSYLQWHIGETIADRPDPRECPIRVHPTDRSAWLTNRRDRRKPCGNIVLAFF